MQVQAHRKIMRVWQPEKTVATMYVCNCNGLNERMVDEAVAEGARTVAAVFREHECRVQCGRCVGDMRNRINACRHLDSGACRAGSGLAPEHFLVAAE